MRGIRIGMVAGGLVLALALVGCGGGDGENSPGLPSLPTSLPSGFPTGLPSGFPTTLPSGIPTSLPSGVPTGIPGSGTLTTGSAHVEISGDATATLDLTQVSAASYIPGTALGVVWQDGEGGSFSIGGLAGKGSSTTSPTLEVSFSSSNPVIVAASVAGECTVNIDDATDSHLAGSVTCQNLNMSGQNLDVDATFEASA